MAIREHIQARSEESANESVGGIYDTRVHIIIYLLIPHRVKDFDIAFITELQNDTILEYGQTRDTVMKLTPLPSKGTPEDTVWVEKPPRCATVIPVIAKADAMTNDEKHETQRALADGLAKADTFKWVNLRHQFPPGNADRYALRQHFNTGGMALTEPQGATENPVALYSNDVLEKLANAYDSSTINAMVFNSALPG